MAWDRRVFGQPFFFTSKIFSFKRSNLEPTISLKKKKKNFLSHVDDTLTGEKKKGETHFSQKKPETHQLRMSPRIKSQLSQKERALTLPIGRDVVGPSYKKD